MAPVRRGMVGCVACLAIVLPGCGGSSGGTSPGSQAAVSLAKPRSQVLALTCSDSWAPNDRTFDQHHWRRHSITVGPIILMGARDASDWSFARQAYIKFRTLVRPRTGITVAIGADATNDVGFVLYPGGTAGERAPDAKQILRLEGCEGIPRDLRSDPTVPGVGYPMFLSVARDRCVDFAVTPHGGRTVHRTISLGAGHCRST